MVIGLKTFIERNIPSACNMISIEKEIEKWKLNNAAGLPIIVIDLAVFYRRMCDGPQAQLDVLMGKHERILNKTEWILERLQKMGAQLVFFCCGPSRYDRNLELICKRKIEQYNTVDKILRMINDEFSPEYILSQLKGSIFNNGSYFVTVTMLALKYGRVHKSYHNECKRDIALYASKHKAFAVLSGDTDYILINGQWSFWDIHNFDTARLKIAQYDQAKIRDYLKLSDDELPLIGVFAEKHFPANILYNFVKSLGDMNHSFRNIAGFICRNFRNKNVSPRTIAEILSSRDVDRNAEIAEESLRLFKNRIDSEPVVEDELSITVKSVHNSFVCEFLYNLPISVEPLFLCKSLYQKFMDASLEIYQRQMGVVLQHIESEQQRVVFCYTQPNISIKTVCPVYPSMVVPSLLRLYNKVDDASLLETKLKLLSWILSDVLVYTTIENIPKQYLCAVLTLVNLVENKIISRDEADCILYCVHECTTDPDSKKSLSYPDLIRQRPFHLIFLYDKFHQLTTFSMNTVGLSNLVECNQLDGVYFHQQYEKLIHMSEDERVILLEPVIDYRIYGTK